MLSSHPEFEKQYYREPLKRQPGLVQTAAQKPLSRGQHTVVNAALSVLLNEAVLRGCPLQRAELRQHAVDFKGGGFPLFLVSSYNSCGKKNGERGAWRKVSARPHKKSGRFSAATWQKPVLSEKGIKNTARSQQNCNRSASLSKQKITVKTRLG